MPRLPSKQYIITNIKKKFWKRLSWLSLISIIAILGDEYIKEGYLFNPTEATNPYCHEFWIMVFIIISITSTYISKTRGGDDELAK